MASTSFSCWRANSRGRRAAGRREAAALPVAVEVVQHVEAGDLERAADVGPALVTRPGAVRGQVGRDGVDVDRLQPPDTEARSAGWRHGRQLIADAQGVRRRPRTAGVLAVEPVEVLAGATIVEDDAWPPRCRRRAASPPGCRADGRWSGSAARHRPTGRISPKRSSWKNSVTVSSACVTRIDSSGSRTAARSAGASGRGRTSADGSVAAMASQRRSALAEIWVTPPNSPRFPRTSTDVADVAGERAAAVEDEDALGGRRIIVAVGGDRLQEEAAEPWLFGTRRAAGVSRRSPRRGRSPTGPRSAWPLPRPAPGGWMPTDWCRRCPHRR